MKRSSIRRNSCQGISMTEYLIILSIIAIAAIAVVGLFGKQIKQTFTRNTGAMGGNTIGVDNKNTSDSVDATKNRDNMGQFDNAATGAK